MALEQRDRPGILARLNPFYRLAAPSPTRALSLDDDGNFDRGEGLSSAAARRLYRSNADIVAVQGAVFAAIRQRVRAIARPRIFLLETRAGEEVEIDEHPALLRIE